MNIAWITGLTLAMALLSRWLGAHISQIAPYFLFRLILFPGIVLHETAHVVGCIITGAQIHRIHFWTQSGGEVVHTNPKIPLIGQPIISFAPFVAGLAALIFLSHYVTAEPLAITWQRGVSLLCMASVGATLIPSKQDFANSWLSALIIIIGLGTLFFYWPTSWEIANRLAEPLIQPFLVTVALIAFFVLITKLLFLRHS